MRVLIVGKSSEEVRSRIALYLEEQNLPKDTVILIEDSVPVRDLAHLRIVNAVESVTSAYEFLETETQNTEQILSQMALTIKDSFKAAEPVYAKSESNEPFWRGLPKYRRRNRFE